MIRSGRGWARAAVVGVALLLDGCATAYQHGETALHEGRYLEAASRFGEVLADDPGRVDALVGLGLAQYHLDSFDAAVGSLGRAVLAVPDHAEARLYLALAYLALGDQGAAARQLEALAGLGIHPRIAAQAGRAATLLRLGALPAGTRDFVRKGLEDEADWQRELIEARLASHMYLGPTWFMYDPSGWSFLGWYPYGMPRP
jgi:tetratricopeptide (TPR) repeat protein